MNVMPSRWELAFYVTLVVFMLGGSFVGLAWTAWNEDLAGYLIFGAVAFVVVYVIVYRSLAEMPRRGAYPYAPPPALPPGKPTDYLAPLK